MQLKSALSLEDFPSINKCLQVEPSRLNYKKTVERIELVSPRVQANKLHQSRNNRAAVEVVARAAWGQERATNTVVADTTDARTFQIH